MILLCGAQLPRVRECESSYTSDGPVCVRVKKAAPVRFQHQHLPAVCMQHHQQQQHCSVQSPRLQRLKHTPRKQQHSAPHTPHRQRGLSLPQNCTLQLCEGPPCHGPVKWRQSCPKGFTGPHRKHRRTAHRSNTHTHPLTSIPLPGVFNCRQPSEQSRDPSFSPLWTAYRHTNTSECQNHVRPSPKHPHTPGLTATGAALPEHDRQHVNTAAAVATPSPQTHTKQNPGGAPGTTLIDDSPSKTTKTSTPHKMCVRACVDGCLCESVH